MRKQTRKRYDKEFKIMVVNLCFSGKTAQSVAADMDLEVTMVREHKKYECNSFQENGNPVRTVEQEEIAKLKAEIRQTQIECDILKKAVSIFSKSDNTNLSL
ncbi:hypothetical protein K5X82_09895 [Halosquirtibacter xylanolyticus]|uniref:transposase n=1 Tax=Halosquirtibacter xylanolyticus TaxID=3374599 RepID=UPI003748EA18|nr:hypothetical protein K5X82_09895 [Prolixibacteraceae bacterium]